MALARLDRRAHALVGERRRQADVDDREVGLVAADDAQQPGAVLGLGDDLDVVLAQQRDDALAQQRLVLGDHDPHGSSARIVVPPPGGLATRERAVERLDAVAQPGQAAAARGSAPPGPSSATSTTSSVRAPRRASTRAPRAARVLGDVGQRLGDDEVRRGLDHRRRPPVDVRVDGRPGSPTRRPSASTAAASPRSASTGGAIPRARSRSSAIAALASPRALADELGDLGLVGEPLLGAAELHAQRDEPRLRAVVQVALDPPQLGGLDVERAAPGAGELVDALGQLAARGPGSRCAVTRTARSPPARRPCRGPGTPASR